MIRLSSLSRSSGSMNEPIFRLKMPIQARGFRVVSCNVPKSYYLLTSANNVIIIREANSTPHNIIVPIGNYNASELAAELQLLIRAELPAWINMTVTFSKVTNMFTFFNSTLQYYAPDWTNQTKKYPSVSLPEVLGFNTSTSPTYRETSLAGYLYADHVCNLALSSSVSLCSKSFAGAIGRIYYDGCLEVPDYLLNVPALGVPFGESIIYEPEDLSFAFIGEKVISDIDLTFRNEAGNIVDFNFVPFEVTLRFY